MKLPFTVQKRYISSFSSADILDFVSQLEQQTYSVFGFKMREYDVKLSNANFEFQKIRKKSDVVFHAKICGTVLPNNALEIKVQPDLTPLIIFGLIAIVVGFINLTSLVSLFKTWDFSQLILPALASAFAFYYYKRVTNPVKRSVLWIEETLELTAI